MMCMLKTNVLRIALIVVNYIFAILSFGLIGLGVVYFDDFKNIRFYIINGSFDKLPILLILLGILSFIASIVGCCFTKYYTDRYVKLFVAFLGVLLIIELTIACIAFLNFNSELSNITVSKMHNQLIDDKSNGDFHIIENQYRCCAIYGLEDYISGKYNPDNGTHCYKRIDKASHNDIEGCAETIVSRIDRTGMEIGCFAIIFAVLQTVDILCLLCMLAKNIQLKINKM